MKGVARVAQLWGAKLPIESFVIDRQNPVEKVDELNRNVPEESWELGLDGKPRAPWQLNHVVYLIDERDGSTYTMINSTKGMAMAWENLVSQVQTKRALLGPRVVPVVVIGSALMRNKKLNIVKERPEFIIVDMKGFNGDEPQWPLLKPIAPLTTAEKIQDELPLHPMPSTIPAKAKVDIDCAACIDAGRSQRRLLLGINQTLKIEQAALNF